MTCGELDSIINDAKRRGWAVSSRFTNGEYVLSATRQHQAVRCVGTFLSEVASTFRTKLFNLEPN